MIAIWMDRFVEFGNGWLLLLYLATWRALPILLVVALLGLLLNKRLSPAIHTLLWTTVIVRFLLPFSVESPLSIHGQIDTLANATLGEPSLGIEMKSQSDHLNLILPIIDPKEDAEANSRDALNKPIVSRKLHGEDYFGISILLTVVGITAVVLLRGIVSHVRFAISLRNCRLLDNQPLIDLVLHECDSLAVGRRPALREVPSLAAPAVFGLFRKTICLPPGLTETLSEQELRWVIRHELAHIRRRDIPVVIIASVAGAFHWFNPIVWLIISRLRAAMEAAADRLALQSLSQNEVSAYGELLLRFAQDSIAAKKSPTLGLISFASGNHLKKRVKLLIRDNKPNGLTTKCRSAMLVGAIALVGLTDARDVVDNKMPQVNLISSDSTGLRVQKELFDPFSEQELGGPISVQEYDVTSIFETMPMGPKRTEKTPQEQLTTWIPLPPWMKEKLHVDGNKLSAELTASQHQLLKQTLEAWKNGEPAQITIETRFIQTNIKTASLIDWAERRIDGLTVRGLGPAIAARIDEEELAQLIRAASADRRGSILLAPKVTMFDGQSAGIADQAQRPFVTGIDPKADGRMQPVVSIVDEGLRFVLTPKTSDDGSVDLAFKVKASRIGKVSYANLPIGASNFPEAGVTVQVPATEQYEVSSLAKLATGESIVVAIPRVFDNQPGADAETTMIVALTPRIIDLQESSVATGPSNQ